MDPEAAFLAAYALVLVCCAAGLRTLGRRSANFWSSKMLTASRPQDAPRAGAEASWPHSEVPSFHEAVSGVMLSAALLLILVSLARHHRPIELAVQLALGVFITGRILRTVARRRALP